jgi:adenylate kinase
MAKTRRITCLTGTPGTGKSSIGEILRDRGHRALEIEEFARIHGTYSHMENGETLVIDTRELAYALKIHLRGFERAFIIGHLSHHYEEPGAVVVLRAEPRVLRERLEAKGWEEAKISENVEAEALDICLGEAMARHGEKVHEIDTSHITTDEAARMVLEIHGGRARYRPRSRDWLLEHILKESRG